MIKFLVKITSSRISNKISFFVSVFMVIIFILLEMYNFTIIKSEVTNKIHIEQSIQANFIAQDINNKLTERRTFLNALADLMSLEKLPPSETLIQSLKKHLTFTDFFPQGFTVIKPDGNGMIAEYPELKGRKKLILTQSEWFIRAKNSHEVITSIPFRSKVLKGEVLIVMAKAIRDEFGNIIGVLQAPIFLNSPNFMGYTFDENYRIGSEITIVSTEHRIFVSSSNPSKILQKIPERGDNYFYDTVMDGFNGYKETTDILGHQILSATADTNSKNWSVIVSTPVSKALHDLNKRLQTSIINGFLIGVIAILTITFFLHKFFTPLRQAAVLVRKMVIEKKTLSHIKKYKNDEIGDLIIGFNALIDLVNERSGKLEKAYGELESLSKEDALTGIFNRGHFDHSLRHVWSILTRSQEPLTLLMIDIDHFKKYNDTYGHTIGDDCLKKVAQTLQNSLNRPTDFVARYGGEEFIIFLQGAPKEGIAVAEKVRLAVNNLNILHQESSYDHVTISLGIASMIPKSTVNPVELIKQADIALYQSKNLGRNRSELYILSMEEQQKE